MCETNVSTAKYETCHIYQAGTLYNHLPNDLKSLNMTRLKKSIKNILLIEGYYSTKE